MTTIPTLDHFQDLLGPLYEAGWSVASPMRTIVTPDSPGKILQIGVRRSCMVLGVQLVPEPRANEQLVLVPLAEHVHHPDDGIEFFDAVPRLVTLAAVSHGLIPHVVAQLAGQLGLLDPMRWTLDPGDNIRKRQALADQLHFRFVARVAATWRGGHTMTPLKALDTDDTFTSAAHLARHLAPNVIPDPVPMAAAIGLTLQCWRHTAIEDAHATNRALTAVVMAKLNIVTTKSARRYITAAGVDRRGVEGVLLDLERQLPDNTGRTVGDLVGSRWLVVAKSIHDQLEDWQHIDDAAGPEATLRLLSVMGSTSYTERWWGTGWWATFSDGIVRQIAERQPASVGFSHDEFALQELAMILTEAPESLPDAVLSDLIDPPDGHGLRSAPLPQRSVCRLGWATTSETGERRAAA